MVRLGWQFVQQRLFMAGCEPSRQHEAFGYAAAASM
jgi:hypothetical protein